MDFSSREQSPHIIVSLLDEEHSTPINALIDSGAAGNFISEQLANEIGVMTRNVGPINATNVDGSRIKPITKQTVPLHLEVAGRLQPTKLLVADIGEEMILGLPWLRKYNPSIDWAAQTLEIAKVAIELPIRSQGGTRDSSTDPIQLPEGIPETYIEFAQVFSKQEASRFPPERPYDHAIEVKPDFKPKDCKVYPMTPKQREAHDKFIKENLDKGYIRPSKSPQASPFFFVPKKDPNDLRPCEDYRELNRQTIRNAYPLPLITDLLD